MSAAIPHLGKYARIVKVSVETEPKLFATNIFKGLTGVELLSSFLLKDSDKEAQHNVRPVAEEQTLGDIFQFSSLKSTPITAWKNIKLIPRLLKLKQYRLLYQTQFYLMNELYPFSQELGKPFYANHQDQDQDLKAFKVCGWLELDGDLYLLTQQIKQLSEQVYLDGGIKPRPDDYHVHIIKMKDLVAVAAAQYEHIVESTGNSFVTSVKIFGKNYTLSVEDLVLEEYAEADVVNELFSLSVQGTVARIDNDLVKITYYPLADSKKIAVMDDLICASVNLLGGINEGEVLTQVYLQNELDVPCFYLSFLTGFESPSPPDFFSDPNAEWSRTYNPVVLKKFGVHLEGDKPTSLSSIQFPLDLFIGTEAYPINDELILAALFNAFGYAGGNYLNAGTYFNYGDDAVGNVGFERQNQKVLCALGNDWNAVAEFLAIPVQLEAYDDSYGNIFSYPQEFYQVSLNRKYTINVLGTDIFSEDYELETQVCQMSPSGKYLRLATINNPTDIPVSDSVFAPRCDSFNPETRLSLIGAYAFPLVSVNEIPFSISSFNYSNPSSYIINGGGIGAVGCVYAPEIVSGKQGICYVLLKDGYIQARIEYIDALNNFNNASKESQESLAGVLKQKAEALDAVQIPLFNNFASREFMCLLKRGVTYLLMR